MKTEQCIEKCCNVHVCMCVCMYYTCFDKIIEDPCNLYEGILDPPYPLLDWYNL